MPASRSSPSAHPAPTPSSNLPLLTFWRSNAACATSIGDRKRLLTKDVVIIASDVEAAIADAATHTCGKARWSV